MLSPKPPDCPAVTVSAPMLEVIWKSSATPDKATLSGLSAALSVIVSLPVRFPPAAGVNVMLMVQLAPAATLLPQVLVWPKSPLAAMLLMLSTPFPVLLRVTLCAALVAPVSCAANGSVAVERLTTGPVAVPASATVCGLPLALSVMVRVPVRAPSAVGLNVTVIVQLAPAATLAPQVFAWLKSPLTPMLVMFNAAVPVLLSVIVWSVVEPT